MLDNSDKKWITDTIDEKLYGVKTELRGEIQEMGTEIVTQLRGEMQEMKDEIITQVTFVFENTYEDYIKVIRENVPDITRSYDDIEEKQSKQREEIIMLKTVATDHENRINKLEKAMV